MDGQVIAISEALRFGYDTLKRNLALALALGAAGMVLVLLLNGVSQATGRYPGLALGFGLLSQLVQISFSLVWVRFALAAHDGRKISVDEVLFDPRTLLDYVGVAIVYGLMVTAGLLLLIVPGVYLAVRYGLAGFVVADGGADVPEALHRSSELTRGVRGRLFLFALAVLGVNLLGALALGVGLLFTVPVSVFASARVYRRLAERVAGPRLVAPGYAAHAHGAP
jgi:hypothetical protein